MNPRRDDFNDKRRYQFQYKTNNKVHCSSSEKVSFESDVPSHKYNKKDEKKTLQPKKKTFLEWCEENDVNYGLIRKATRQRLQHNNPDFWYDGFELPKEFQHEELPPVPVTPEQNFPSPFHNFTKSPNSSRNNALFIENEIKRMDKLLEVIKSDASSPQDFEEKEVQRGAERINHQMDNSNPTIVEMKFESQIEDLISPEDAQSQLKTPSWRCVTSTPKTSHVQDGSSLFGSHCNSLKPGRMLFVDETQDFMTEDSEIWPDDDVLSQIDLESHIPVNPPTSGAIVEGEGFEDSDSEADFVLSQINC